LAAGDNSISTVTACSPGCYAGHTIAASPLYSLQALKSPLESLLESLLDSLLDSLLGSLLERAALDKVVLQEYSIP